MKRLLLFLCLWLVAASMWDASAADKVARLTFADTLHDFGLLDEQGGAAAHDFVFTNTGDAPLVIYEVNTNCDCTAADFPQAPVMPGEKGKITITFYPEGNAGEFAKEIIIKSNAKKRKSRVYIRGMVAPRQ